jgi:hypothetical protein
MGPGRRLNAAGIAWETVSTMGRTLKPLPLRLGESCWELHGFGLLRLHAGPTNPMAYCRTSRFKNVLGLICSGGPNLRQDPHCGPHSPNISDHQWQAKLSVTQSRLRSDHGGHCGTWLAAA